jgi:hypothetical protein
MEGHQIGWRTFEARYVLALRDAAELLARLSPHITSFCEEKEAKKLL